MAATNETSITDSVNSSEGNETEELRSSQGEESNMVELIFQYSVIIVGIVGTLANGINIMIFLKKSHGTKISTSNKLILNQMTLDLFSCMSLILVFGWKVVNVKLNRNWSYFSCCLIYSEELVWSPVIGSVINLVFITLERYWKIVHNTLYQKFHRNWITSMAILLPWMVGFALTIPFALAFVIFSDDICSPMNFPSHLDALIYGDILFVSIYVIPVLVFGICYGHILVTMKASSKFFDNSKDDGETNAYVRDMHYRRQMALVKTMILIIASYIACKTPYSILGILQVVCPQSFSYLWHTSVWYGAMFAGLLESCVHPFIYGARSDFVRNYLKEAFWKLWHGTSSVDPISAATETRF